jgi:hypothetical protein
MARSYASKLKRLSARLRFRVRAERRNPLQHPTVGEIAEAYMSLLIFPLMLLGIPAIATRSCRAYSDMMWLEPRFSHDWPGRGSSNSRTPTNSRQG